MNINRRHVIFSGLGAAAVFSAGSTFGRAKTSEPIIDLYDRVPSAAPMWVL